MLESGTKASDIETINPSIRSPLTQYALSELGIKVQEEEMKKIYRRSMEVTMTQQILEYCKPKNSARQHVLCRYSRRRTHYLLRTASATHVR